MMKWCVVLLALLAGSVHAQLLFDGTQGSNPVIYNTISTSGSVRAAQLIIPTQAAGVVPVGIRGTVAVTSVGDICFYTGTTWIKLNAINIITGLSTPCTF